MSGSKTIQISPHHFVRKLEIEYNNSVMLAGATPLCLSYTKTATVNGGENIPHQTYRKKDYFVMLLPKCNNIRCNI